MKRQTEIVRVFFGIQELFGIRAAQTKTYRQIHDKIRAAQQHGEDGFGRDWGAFANKELW